MNAIDTATGFARLPEETTSVLLRRILAQLPANEVRIGHLVRQLRRRSFGGLFMLLAALALVPGISAFAGLAMLIPGVQMALGMRAPLLPRPVRQRTVRREVLQAFGARAIPWLERLERLVRPRWLVLTIAPMPTVIGCLVVGLAGVVILPLPFSNFPPAAAIILLSLGMLERDGVLVFVGLVFGAAALAIGVAISAVAVRGLMLIMG